MGLGLDRSTRSSLGVGKVRWSMLVVFVNELNVFKVKVRAYISIRFNYIHI